MNDLNNENTNKFLGSSSDSPAQTKISREIYTDEEGNTRVIIRQFTSYSNNENEVGNNNEKEKLSENFQLYENKGESVQNLTKNDKEEDIKSNTKNGNIKAKISKKKNKNKKKHAHKKHKKKNKKFIPTSKVSIFKLFCFFMFLIIFAYYFRHKVKKIDHELKKCQNSMKKGLIENPKKD